MRRIPSQVPQAVSRLLQGSVLSTPPTWYIPVLSHPPPQLPPRQVVNRARRQASPTSSSRSGSQAQDQVFSDVASIPAGELERRDRLRKYKSRKNRPARISYEEDSIRRQFFKDFPFEALRPTSLVEALEIDESVKITGEKWTSLAQRGDYPTVEDCVDYVLNIHRVKQLPLSESYALATQEFVALRARHEISTIAAEVEARYHGAEFKPDAFERQFNLEEKALSTLIPPSTRSSESSKIKYRELPRWSWSNTVSPISIPSGEFSGGRSYVEKWKLPAPLLVSAIEGQAQAQGDLMSAIGNPSAGAGDQNEGAAQENAESLQENDNLEFLQNVLSKSRTGSS